MVRFLFFAPLLLILGGCSLFGGKADEDQARRAPTRDDGEWLYLAPEDLALGRYHTRHAEVFGKYVSGYNRFVLEGVDAVQAHAADGGGYFIGVKAIPAESPIGYDLALLGQPLLKAPRTTSYCSGSSYSAFIEALNLIYPDAQGRLSPERLEAMRMQEPDGGRREDGVKFWGHWNDDGNGSQFALVQYSGMGVEIPPKQARPGDFMNISWNNGGGHSVVFLGWSKNSKGEKGIAYWSSQKGTNGLSDVILDSLERIREVKTVRLTVPGRLFEFDPQTPVNRKVPGDTIPNE